jgi:glutathione S-transferase
MTMKLHYFPGACSLAPHIVAREAGVPIELDKVDMETGKTEKGQDYAATVTAKGYVPALRLDDGTVLTEGAVIQQYLADRAPQKNLIPPAGSIERYRAQEWLNYIATEVHKGFAPLFGDGSEEQKKAGRDALAPKFALVEKALAGKRYLFGDTFSAADAYLFTVLSWSKYTNVTLPRALSDYLGRVAERPAVLAALKAEGLV